MADDIVTRLRYAAKACNHGYPNGVGDSFPDPTHCGGCLRLNDAADEIDRLRAAGDALAEALRGWCDGMDVFEEDQDRVRAWEEARRG